jgi:hypothetical protein
MGIRQQIEVHTFRFLKGKAALGMRNAGVKGGIFADNKLLEIYWATEILPAGTTNW